MPQPRALLIISGIAQRGLHRRSRSIPEAGDHVAVDVQRNGDARVPEHLRDYLRVDAFRQQ